MTTNIKRLVERAIAGLSVLALGTGLTISSLLSPVNVGALPTGGQVQSRAIYMTNAAPSGAATYTVTFKPASTTAIDGIVLDFCSNDPIIGDSCTAPAGFSLGTPTVTYAAHGADSPVPSTATQGLPITSGSWSASASSGTLKLTAGANNSGALTTSNIYSFDVTTITNPSAAPPATTTFYARIITYTSNTAVTSDFANYTATTPGSTATTLDYGGFALSTDNNVNITTRVQETLTFCTSGTFSIANDATQLLNPMDGTNGAIVGGGQSGGPDCTHATAPNITIGHGSPTSVIDNSQIDASLAFTQASTNASSGMVVRMKATNVCANAGLSTDGGTTCNIKGIDSAGAASGQTAGTTFFGLHVEPGYTTSGVATSAGTLPADANYGGACTVAVVVTSCNFGMDNTSNSGGVASTYGDIIAASTSAISQINNKLLFGATAGLTVPAGIYTGSESLIATGTF